MCLTPARTPHVLYRDWLVLPAKPWSWTPANKKKFINGRVDATDVCSYEVAYGLPVVHLALTQVPCPTIYVVIEKMNTDDENEWRWSFAYLVFATHFIEPRFQLSFFVERIQTFRDYKSKRFVCVSLMTARPNWILLSVWRIKQKKKKNAEIWKCKRVYLQISRRQSHQVFLALPRNIATKF